MTEVLKDLLTELDHAAQLSEVEVSDRLGDVCRALRERGDAIPFESEAELAAFGFVLLQEPCERHYYVPRSTFKDAERNARGVRDSNPRLRIDQLI